MPRPDEPRAGLMTQSGEFASVVSSFFNSPCRSNTAYTSGVFTPTRWQISMSFSLSSTMREQGARILAEDAADVAGVHADDAASAETQSEW